MKDQNRWDDLLQQYGYNSNAFLTKYPGFQLFTAPGIEGAIAYFDTRFCWIGTTEPLAPPASFESLTRLFAQAARKQGKSVLFIPVEEPFAEQLEALGYGRIMIGAEPYVDLTSRVFDVTSIATAKHLAHSGVVVEEFHFDQISAEEREQCDSLISEWMNSRWIPPLGFVNRVLPWEYSRQKKYFWARRDRRLLALLAAVPIAAGKGWYFVDLFRHPDSPAGSIELLVLQSMQLLKEQGYRCVSLGVSPLSKMEKVDFQTHPILYPLLLFVFHSFNIFYRFKPLYRFKCKFSPSYWRASYLLYPGYQLTLRQCGSLGEAFLPHGLFSTLFCFVARSFHRGALFSGLEKVMARDILFLPSPQKNGREFLETIRFSLSFIGVGLVGHLLGFFSSHFSLVALGSLAAFFIEIFSGPRIWVLTLLAGLVAYPSLDGISLGFLGASSIMFRRSGWVFAAMAMVLVVPLAFQGIVVASSGLISLSVGALASFLRLRLRVGNPIQKVKLRSSLTSTFKSFSETASSR